MSSCLPCTQWAGCRCCFAAAAPCVSCVLLWCVAAPLEAGQCCCVSCVSRNSCSASRLCWTAWLCRWTSHGGACILWDRTMLRRLSGALSACMSMCVCLRMSVCYISMQDKQGAKWVNTMPCMGSGYCRIVATNTDIPWSAVHRHLRACSACRRSRSAVLMVVVVVDQQGPLVCWWWTASGR